MGLGVSPDENQIAFGQVRPDASAVDVWHLAYERRQLNANLSGVGMGLGPSRVWLLDLNNSQSDPWFQDNQMLGYAPRWSPDGKHVAYDDPQGGVRILKLATGATQLIPNQQAR